MRKSKLEKRAKNVFKATTKELESFIKNENDLKIFTYFFNAPENKFSITSAEIMANISKSIVTPSIKAKQIYRNLARVQLLDILPLMREELKPNTCLLVLMNLFELNEILVEYTRYPNRMELALTDDKLIIKNFSLRDAIKQEIGRITEGNLWEELGYDVALVGKIKKKFEEILNWLPKGVARIIKYNKEFLDPKSLELLVEKRNVVLDGLCKDIDFTVQGFSTEIKVFNEMLSRVAMIRHEMKNIEKEITNKNDIRYFKTLLTKLEKLMNIQYELIENGFEII